MNTAGWCDAAYIFGCRKFSASVVNGQNDSMIFCIRVTRGIVSALHPSMARESIRRRLLSYSSRSTLMTHTDTPNTSQIKSNQIKSLLLSHHHSTSALVSEILMSVLQTVQKNNRQFTYGQTVQKKNNKQFTYGQTVQKNCTGAFTVLQTVQKKTTTAIYIWTDSAKKTTTAIYIWTDSAKKTTAIYIWTVHIYRLYRRQCAKYTYMHSVRLVYYRDILNYQRHIIHRMGTSTLCTVSIHNVVYT